MLRPLVFAHSKSGTLLDILAMRKTTGTTYGSILVCGMPRKPSFLRQVAYVTQEDLFLPHMVRLL